jgi:hypothetical protein
MIAQMVRTFARKHEDFWTKWDMSSNISGSFTALQVYEDVQKALRVPLKSLESHLAFVPCQST